MTAPRHRIGQVLADGYGFPLAVALTVLWVGALTLWSYYPNLFLLHTGWGNTTLVGAVVVHHLAPSLWLASFLSAFTVGVTAFPWIRGTKLPGHAAVVGQAAMRRRRIQRVGSLCLAIALYQLVCRIIHVLLMTGTALADVEVFLGGNPVWAGGGVRNVLDSMLVVTSLAAGLALLQLMGRYREARTAWATTGLFFTALLVVGLVIPWSGLHRRLPSPFPGHVWDAGARVSAGGPQATYRHMRAFFRTHDASGGPVSDLELIYPENRVAPENCGVCRLPSSVLLTTEGLPLDLSAGPGPLARSPEVVVEVPRSGEEARLYGHDRSAPFRKLAPHELTAAESAMVRLATTDRYARLIPYIERAFRVGVRRVDLSLFAGDGSDSWRDSDGLGPAGVGSGPPNPTVPTEIPPATAVIHSRGPAGPSLVPGRLRRWERR